MAWLYLLILLVVAFGLWGAYRVLGTPSRLDRRDYDVVLADIRTSVERAAGRLRRALEAGPTGKLEDEASAGRKIFQTGYYQTLRLRPSNGPDVAAAARAELGRACEAYDWASRMLGSESVRNPLVLDAARRLLDAGDEAVRRAAKELPSLDAPRGNSGP
jgi:cytochrome c-type biogenesis protein CcmH/NrfG